ncbi:hypothetical protein CGZ80_21670 [Rhodopirellula sp. MGV]|nr:hypothetical protein CGZ80_21670 [Rhodopirellula sp. MGV]PNY37486.1 hypothetical protein C2E31_08185 [Rhodopirellula baltica]
MASDWFLLDVGRGEGGLQNDSVDRAGCRDPVREGPTTRIRDSERFRESTAPIRASVGFARLKVGRCEPFVLSAAHVTVTVRGDCNGTDASAYRLIGQPVVDEAMSPSEAFALRWGRIANCKMNIANWKLICRPNEQSRSGA